MNSTTPGSMLKDALTVAAPSDIYYYGSKTMKKQSISTIQRTNFIQNLASKSGGQSVITISPDSGMSHVIVGLELPANGIAGANYAGCALNKGWAYQAIDFVQWRYGSSSLFQKSGEQLMIEAIATAGSVGESEALLQLAGNQILGAANGAGTFSGQKLFAYAVIPLPHCGAQSGTETPNPFPSELLSAPIVITIALKAPSQFLAITGAVGVAPTEFANAYLQVRQVNAVDRGQLMTPSASTTYAFPCQFFQQVNSVQLANTADSQEVVLTGFRSGSVKGIHMWVLDTSDATKLANPHNYELPRDLELSYAGNVIHKYAGVSSQILDVLYTDVPSLFSNAVLAANAGVWSVPGNPITTSWVHFPLSQRFEQLSAEFTSVSGAGISNGVMNLRLRMPDWVAGKSYVLYYVPYYECAMVFNAGNVEYVF